MSGAKVSGSWK